MKKKQTTTSKYRIITVLFNRETNDEDKSD